MKKRILILSLAHAAFFSLCSFTSSNTVFQTPTNKLANPDVLQTIELDTLGITNGSMHMLATLKYADFLKKYKGDKPSFKFHIWYNATGARLKTRDVKAGKDEVYFLYGRNQKTSSIEMAFKFGSNAKAAFSKKKYKELIKFIDLLDFEIFEGQNFSSSMAFEALEKALD
jgi:hypothetical protein